MMRKYMNISIISLLIVSFLLMPLNVRAASANTLRGLRQELASLQEQKRKNDSQKQATESEIKENNIAILNAEEEIQESQEKN